MRFLVVGMLLALTSLSVVCPENILMVTLGGTQSHKVPFLVLGQGLVTMGHEVVLVSGFAPRHSTDIQELAPEKIVETVTTFAKEVLNRKLMGKEPFTLWDTVSYVYKVCVDFYSSDEVQQLLTQDVNLLILDTFYSDCLLGLSHHFHAPVILLNTVAYYSKPFSLTGNPTMYSVTPFFDSDYSDRMDFWERSWNLVKHLMHDSTGWLVDKLLLEPVVRRHLGGDVPSTSDLARNVSLIFQNGQHIVTQPRPFLPNVVEIGCVHCGEAQPLTLNLEEFVSGGNEKGFLYVSFGTSVQTSQFPERLMALMLNAFGKLPYQVLWKFDSSYNKIPDLPKNVRLAHWLPQQDLLGHPKMLAFVNHGGLLGILEAVYHGVPMVVLPVFCDHGVNSRKPKDDGYAVVLALHNLTESELVTAISRVVSDKRYKENAVHRSVLLRDQPESPLARALYWVQYVLRHRGAVHLQSAAKDLNLLQYFMLDTLALAATVFCISLVLIKTMFCMVCRRRTITKTKVN